MKKIIISMAIAFCALSLTTYASVFPVEEVGRNGISQYGYLNEDGTQEIGFFYADATAVNEYGFAIVTERDTDVGIINEYGELVIIPQTAPISVDFSDDQIAYRYENSSIYYDFDGNLIGEYTGAVGFINDGFLCIKKGDSYGYIDITGEMTFSFYYLQAGEFENGRAVVQKSSGDYAVLLSNGAHASLPAQPSELKIEANRNIVLISDDGYRLYSAAEGMYLTDEYDSMVIHEDGYVLVSKDSKWGILKSDGTISVPLQYYYLEYMNSMLYIARGEKQEEVFVIDGSGTRVYFTNAYIGGFEPFVYNMSWHGTMDGGIMFFDNNGLHSITIENAYNPILLSNNVVRITVNGSEQYIRLSDGAVLYDPIREYEIAGGIKVSSTTYEKYIGTTDDGTYYGWELEYPQLSNMTDSDIQKSINAQIEEFFLSGQSLENLKQSLVGNYGIDVFGNVLVVNVNATIGLGENSTIWNDNISIDLSTGERYYVTKDLLTSDSTEYIKNLLPTENAFYLYEYPRMSSDGITYYINTDATSTQKATTTQYKIYFYDILNVLKVDGDCYIALTTNYNTSSNQQQPPQQSQPPQNIEFSDVTTDYWAYEYIIDMHRKGLINGYDGMFRPEDNILISEAIVIITRAMNFENTIPQDTVKTAWYDEEYQIAEQNGIVVGLQNEDLDSALSRLDAMQLIYNIAVSKGTATDMTDEQISNTLSGFEDVDNIPDEFKQAVAYCIENEFFGGYNGKLTPFENITRAEYCKIISKIGSFKN